MRAAYLKQRAAAMAIRDVYRAYRARKRYQQKRLGVIVVQRLVRGYLARRQYRALRRHVEHLQAAVRVALAIQVLQGLYAEQTETPEARKKREDQDALTRADILKRQEEVDRIDMAKRKVRVRPLLPWTLQTSRGRALSCGMQVALGAGKGNSDENMSAKGRAPAPAKIATGAVATSTTTSPSAKSAVSSTPASKDAEAAAAQAAEADLGNRKRKALFPEWDQWLPVDERRSLPLKDAWLRGLKGALPELPSTSKPCPRLTPDQMAGKYGKAPAERP